jgi:hypothetical protein
MVKSEIFLFSETKRRFQVLRSALCFFGTEHAKGRKERERLKEFWHFSICGENSKYLEYPDENVTVVRPSNQCSGKEAYQIKQLF